jgi:hypothetical protein
MLITQFNEKFESIDTELALHIHSMYKDILIFDNYLCLFKIMLR